MDMFPGVASGRRDGELSRAASIVTYGRDRQSLFALTRSLVSWGSEPAISQLGFEPIGHSRDIIHDRGMKPRAPPRLPDYTRECSKPLDIQEILPCAALASSPPPLASPCQRSPPPAPPKPSFHLIRWQDSGFCQIWDQSIPTVPYPGNYTVVINSEVPTFGDALVLRDGLLHNGTCSF